MNLGKYFKTAFVNRWNLLVFLAGAGFATLSGHADVLLPLVLACETAYVGLLASHPKFQAYVDAQEAKAVREEGSVSNLRALEYITRRLPRELFNRFESLRTQCLELRQISVELKHPGKTGSDVPLEEFQVAGLDRLLWIYLRLLYTQFSLERFLQKTTEEPIRQEIGQLEERVKQYAGDDPQKQRMRKALEDNLETSRARLVNLTKARENHEFVQTEISRLENKIRTLSEMAVNRQEPEFISSQVDHVASSMLDTERTMNDLQFATGLDSLDEQAPEMLQARVVKTTRR
ncbi:MAG: hypothetical protein ACYC35_10435 [Pirellulales bacterium]